MALKLSINGQLKLLKLIVKFQSDCAILNQQKNIHFVLIILIGATKCIITVVHNLFTILQ